MEINLVILFKIVLVAVLVQYMVEAIKVPIVQVCTFIKLEERYTSLIAPFLSIGFAITLSILIDGDLFVAFGYTLSALYIGNIVTGIVASLGANRLYSLINELKDYKDKLAIESNKEPYEREEMKNV